MQKYAIVLARCAHICWIIVILFVLCEIFINILLKKYTNEKYNRAADNGDQLQWIATTTEIGFSESKRAKCVLGQKNSFVNGLLWYYYRVLFHRNHIIFPHGNGSSSGCTSDRSRHKGAGQLWKMATECSAHNFSVQNSHILVYGNYHFHRARTKPRRLLVHTTDRSTWRIHSRLDCTSASNQSWSS